MKGPRLAGSSPKCEISKRHGGQTYRVLASTNLLLSFTNWCILTNGTFSAGLVNFTDLAATNAGKYYLITSP